MNERPIWRPNSIPLDEWEKLSREDQIRWWKEQRPSTGSPPHPLRAVKLYQRGAIAAYEFPAFVWERLTEENVAEFLGGCPAELLVLLHEDSRRLPADDDVQGWQGMVSIRNGCYPPWVTTEEIRQLHEAQDQDLRIGLRVFRKTVGGG